MYNDVSEILYRYLYIIEEYCKYHFFSKYLDFNIVYSFKCNYFLQIREEGPAVESGYAASGCTTHASQAPHRCLGLCLLLLLFLSIPSQIQPSRIKHALTTSIYYRSKQNNQNVLDSYIEKNVRPPRAPCLRTSLLHGAGSLVLEARNYS